ncbi:MAG: AAA family ATPase [Planctomycetes bacterium]|nr:AAA family ATPase [Planctomycetota bacterium]
MPRSAAPVAIEESGPVTSRFGPPPTPAIGLAAVAGHVALRRFLMERTASRRLPHALLFLGPTGVGKRTLAQALVAQHFCATGDGCGSCGDCGALLRGNHPGLLTVAVAAGKSSISIEQVQKLAHDLSLSAQDERGRMTLLLGADRMTAAAQDALLKTLEEPRPGNVLVLTATRGDAVLPTIRSRCQRFALLPLAVTEVAAVAARLGITPAIPFEVAAGCPGVLVEWGGPLVDRLRRGVAKLLAEERGREDLPKWLALLHEEQPEEAEPAQLRARARLLLRLAGSLVRDAVVLRASGGTATIRNLDQAERLAQIAGRAEWADAGAALSRLARAADRVEGNVDPASALFCALQPAADEAARAAEA